MAKSGCRMYLECSRFVKLGCDKERYAAWCCYSTMATLKSNVQSDFSSLGISCSASACVQASLGLATPSCCCFNKLSLTNGYLAQGIVQCLPHPEVERDTPKFSFQITVFEQKFCNENGLLCVAVRATFMLTILSWLCQNHHFMLHRPLVEEACKKQIFEPRGCLSLPLL